MISKPATESGETALLPCDAEKIMNAMEAIGKYLDAIEREAFKIPPVNPHTPVIVQQVIGAKNELMRMQVATEPQGERAAVMFQSAVSGLWYESLGAAGDISAVKCGDLVKRLVAGGERVVKEDELEAAQAEKAFVELFGPMEITIGYGRDIEDHRVEQLRRLKIFKAGIEFALHRAKQGKDEDEEIADAKARRTAAGKETGR